MTHRYVSVIGSIATGKSTLIEKLSGNETGDRCKIATFKEKIDKRLLNLFNKDPSHFEVLFQICMIYKRSMTAIQISEWIEENRSVDHLVIEDTSLISNRCFLKANRTCGYISDETYSSMILACDKVEEGLKKSGRLVQPTHVILLDCPAQRCLDNIKLRQRKSEEALTLDYLTALRLAYLEYFDGIDKSITCKISIDVSQNYADPVSVSNDIGLTLRN